MTDPTLLIDGADSAIIGYAVRCGQPPIVVYDRDMLLEHFMSMGASEEEASEWIEFNIVGAWVGDGTPAVLARATREEIDDLILQ